MSGNVINPFIQRITANGEVGIGYKLYFYENETTTPLTIYSDFEQTVPASNPIIANSLGQFAPTYYSGLASVSLKDADDVLISSADGIGIEDGGGGADIVANTIHANEIFQNNEPVLDESNLVASTQDYTTGKIPTVGWTGWGSTAITTTGAGFDLDNFSSDAYLNVDTSTLNSPGTGTWNVIVNKITANDILQLAYLISGSTTYTIKQRSSADGGTSWSTWTTVTDMQSGVLHGVTASTSDDSTKLATTEFVNNHVDENSAQINESTSVNQTDMPRGTYVLTTGAGGAFTVSLNNATGTIRRGFGNSGNSAAGYANNNNGGDVLSGTWLASGFQTATNNVSSQLYRRIA